MAGGAGFRKQGGCTTTALALNKQILNGPFVKYRVEMVQAWLRLLTTVRTEQSRGIEKTWAKTVERLTAQGKTR